MSTDTSTPPPLTYIPSTPEPTGRVPFPPGLCPTEKPYAPGLGNSFKNGTEGPLTLYCAALPICSSTSYSYYYDPETNLSRCVNKSNPSKHKPAYCLGIGPSSLYSIPEISCIGADCSSQYCISVPVDQSYAVKQSTVE